MRPSSVLTRQFSTLNIGVLGAGVMGTGIGLVGSKVAQANVQFVGRTQKTMDKSRAQIERQLNRDVDRKKLSAEQRDQILSRIHYSNQMETIANSDVIIEALTEDFDLKAKAFKEVDQLVSAECLITSSTSSKSISSLANMLKSDQSRFCGLHFMNPVPVMKLVEVIRGLQTSKETIERAIELCKLFGKTPIVMDDSPAFINNRIFNQYIAMGAVALAEGLGTKEDIDTTMKLYTGWPMGPVELADFCGLDVFLESAESMYREFGDNKHKAHPIVSRYVHAGYLGTKVGRGFYDYSNGGKK